MTSRPDHRHVEPATEDERGSFGVGPDVELGRGSHIAFRDRPAHQDDAGDPAGRLGTLLQQPPHVRERADRDERNGLRRLREEPCEEVDRTFLDRLDLRLRQLRPVEPALPMHLERHPSVAHERARRARGHRHVGPARELEHLERVSGRLVERLVPGDRRDGEELDLRAGERKEHRDGVVVAGIAVENDRNRAHAARAVSTSAAVGSDG